GGDAQAATVVLNVRSELGTILRTRTALVPATFPLSGDWVTWDGIDLDVAAGTILLFSAYLQGGFAQNPVSSGYGAHAEAGFATGDLRIKDGASDAAMDVWADWVPHPWDAVFR